jgi:hypothetical protein
MKQRIFAAIFDCSKEKKKESEYKTLWDYIQKYSHKPDDLQKWYAQVKSEMPTSVWEKGADLLWKRI